MDKRLKMEVFNSSYNRIGTFNNYAYCQYTYELCGKGSFELHVPYLNENILLLNTGKYILFDSFDISAYTGNADDKVNIMGEMKYINNKSDNNVSIIIKGFLISNMLERRAFKKTKNYTGTFTTIPRAFVYDNFINAENVKNNISRIRLSSISQFNKTTNAANKQVTGNYVLTEMINLLEPEDMGFDLNPVLVNYDEQSGILTNVSALDFRVIKGYDRSIDNAEGNSHIVFAKTLDNLLSTNYVKNTTDSKNVVIVAGEGEGTSRVIVETGNDTVFGEDRYELYVDARDLQSTDSYGNVITSEQYNEMLVNRGKEKLSEHKDFESMSGTIAEGNTKYQFCIDFFLGDYVSIIIEDLNKVLKAVVKTYTKTTDEDGSVKEDFQFGWKKISDMSILKRGGSI